MPRDLDDGGHLRATGATAGGLGHLALLHTSTYHPVPIQAKQAAFSRQFGNFGRGIFRNLGTNVENRRCPFFDVFRSFFMKSLLKIARDIVEVCQDVVEVVEIVGRGVPGGGCDGVRYERAVVWPGFVGVIAPTHSTHHNLPQLHAHAR